MLVTGPTGSGKTTTLYSTLKELATPDVNVCTVEDPIEMVAPEFNQMQVQPGDRPRFRQRRAHAAAAGSGHHHGRRNPRPAKPREMAVQAALTGHLVLSTLHTNDAPTAVTRLLDLGVPHYLIQSTLIGVMAQRLVRTLCPHCKKPADPPDEETWRMLTAPFVADLPQQVQSAGRLPRVPDDRLLRPDRALRDHDDDARRCGG